MLAERPGPEHCGWEDATVLITGRTLGEPYTTAVDDREYVRDPERVFGDTTVADGFDPDARIPATAIDSGFRRGDAELWHDPADPSAVWLASPTGVERWPEGEPPVCR